MKRKILILCPSQFGYHTDTFMYCKYLDKNKYYIHYFCFNVGLPIIGAENVTIHYVKTLSNKFLLYFNYFRELVKVIRNEKFDLIFQLDAKFAFIIRLITFLQPAVLDIRSGDLSDNRIKLWFKNRQIKFVTLFYKEVTVISGSLRDYLGLNRNKTTILPLGGEYQNISPKTFETIRLIYFGTLSGRNIHETVYGLGIYLKKEKSFQAISYDIIGFGNENIIEKLKGSIHETGLCEKVTFHGRKKIEELYPFYNKCNVGIVYIPQTRAYDFQPATKLFECLLAGMPVIATNTLENRISLIEGCGVITEDNPEAFANALDLLIKHKDDFDSDKIKNKYSDSDWESLVLNQVEPFFDRFIREYHGY